MSLKCRIPMSDNGSKYRFSYLEEGIQVPPFQMHFQFTAVTFKLLSDQGKQSRYTFYQLKRLQL